MSRPYRMFAVFAALCGCVVSAGTETSTNRPLVLELSVEQAQIVLYEPLLLTYSVANVSEHTVSSRLVMPSDRTRLLITITNVAGETVQYVSGGPIEAVVRTKAHRPGDVAVAEKTILWNDSTGSVAFSSRGRYSIDAKILVRRRPTPLWLDARPVEIEVVSRTESDEQLTQEFGSDEALLEALREGTSSYCRGRTSSSCLETLRAAITRFADSSYAPFLARDLVNALAAGLLDVPGERALAREIAEDALSRWPRHPASRGTGQIFIRLLLDEGLDGEALGRIEEYENAWPRYRKRMRAFRELLVRQ